MGAIESSQQRTPSDMGFKIAGSEKSMSKNNSNTNSAKDIGQGDSTINEQENVLITAVNDADESY